MEIQKLGSNNTLERLRESGALVILPGLALTVLGILALMSPLHAELSAADVIGGLLIAAGVVRAVAAIQFLTWAAGLLGEAVALLSLLAGLHLLTSPGLRHGYFTLVLAVFLVVDGIFSGVLAASNRSEKGWGWMLGSSMSTVLLGAMVLYKWPWALTSSTAAAAGLSLILTGAALAHLGVSPRGSAQRISAADARREERAAPAAAPVWHS